MKAWSPALALLSLIALGFVVERRTLAMEDTAEAVHVFPGDNIQEAIERAAARSSNKVVRVHAGEYRPVARRPAMIWFNRKHDGVRVEAVGSVTLTAANPELARSSSPTFPAIVNHVVYFGHDVSSNTVLRGFRITGANGYITEKFFEQIEPDKTVPKNSFLVTDGGAIKIFGRSAPVLENLEIEDNYASPCGGGVSVQQQGLKDVPVVFRNCIFRKNRAQVTGAALDLLEGSAAMVENCLFVGNVANTGIDVVARRSGEKPFENSAPLTIFQNSQAVARNCTFTGNRNGVDDLSGASIYESCIFFGNSLAGGKAGLARYDLDLQKGGRVTGCFFGGSVLDPSHSISSSANQLNAPHPGFNAAFEATAELYRGAGFRVRKP